MLLINLTLCWQWHIRQLCDFEWNTLWLLGVQNWVNHMVVVVTLTLGLQLNVKCKGPWGQECLLVWNTLLQMMESARDEAQWLPNALPLWELHSCESYKCSEPWLERQKNIKLCPHDTIRKVLNPRWLKCPHIVHLNLICMSYDQKKGRESNWEFDFRPQIPWK
jgi:hypothetical protein